MSLLALALAAEIGAAAPSELKPCAAPAIEKQAGHGLYTHIRRIKTDCAEIAGPFAVLFPPKESPLDYISTPEAPAFGIPVDTEQASPQAAQDEVPGQETFAYSGPYGGAFTAFGPIALVAVDARPALIPAVPEPALIYTLAVGLLALVWRRA